MRPPTLQLILVPIILLIVLFPVSSSSHALNFSIKQESFEISDLLPNSDRISAQTLSKPLIQQTEILTYLNSDWDLSKILSYGLSGAIEIICQAKIKATSIINSSNSDLNNYNSELEDSFNQILTTEIASSAESLNKTSTGLFYTWNSSVGNVSTSMNLWIAKALLASTPTDNSSIYLQAKSIINELNLTNREVLPPFYFREYVLIDIDEIVIPGSLSSFALLKDQILAMQVILHLSHGSTNPIFTDDLQMQARNIEFSIFHPTDGFVDGSTEVWSQDLSLGFFHSKRNQNSGGAFFTNNNSKTYFFDTILLLEYVLQQLEFQSDQLTISNYQNIALKLISDILIVFQGESLYYHCLSISNITSTNEFLYLDFQIVREQFEFIDLILSYSDWFSIRNEDLIIDEQLKGLILPLWNYLTSNAYISTEKLAGIGASNQASSVGYFYAYYSSTLGLFLYGNSSITSLFFANVIAVYALGRIFPYQVTVDYTDFLTKRDNQTLGISIIPLNLGSGTYINVDVMIDIPSESISNVKIARININTLSTVTIPYSYQITEEGDVSFTVDLMYQGLSVIKIQGKYTTLRIMSIKAEVNPNSPQQGESLKITLEARDSVGILRSDVYYYAQIESETLVETLWINNQSLFLVNGSISTIDLSPSQTKSNLRCYFLFQKNGYYPAEMNLTISMQTPLNFLFSWLFMLIFESEIGGYLGTLSAIFALLWGFHTRIFRRITRQIKSCPHCGGIYHKKYLVCSHCGRDIKEVKKQIDSEKLI